MPLERQRRKAMIAVPIEWGGLLPILPLAHTLAQRNWDILFAAAVPLTGGFHKSEKIVDLITSQGFEFTNLWPDTDDPEPYSPRFMTTLTENATKFFRDRSASIVLAQDSTLVIAAAAAKRTGVPIVALYTHLGDFFNLSCPPISSSYVPQRRQTVGNTCRIIWEWTSRIIPRVHVWAVLNILVRRLQGFPLSFGFNGFTFIPKVAHGVVIGPAALDYPTRRARMYFGSHMPPNPDAVMDRAWEWPPIGTGRRLIYCSIGEYSHVYRHGVRFLRTVVAAMEKRPDLGMIMQIGRIDPREIVTTRPENVCLLDWVPQREVLERADLAITNGGFGTIKECVESRTPMLVLPFAFDQHGNAARVRFHGIGLTADGECMHETTLRHMIDTILNDPTYASSIVKMRNRIVSDREREASETVRYLESIASGPATRPGE